MLIYLSENEPNAKNNTEVYAKKDVTTTVIKRCRGEKKRRKKDRWIQRKVDDSRLQDFRMSKTLSQIKNRKHICQ